MPHVELGGLTIPVGPAEWIVIGLLVLAGAALLVLAARYARRARRVRAGAGTHRTAAEAAPPAGGSTAVCTGLGIALLGVAASMIAGIAVG